MRGRGHYQQIPPTINDSSMEYGSGTSLVCSKLFGAIHAIVGTVLPVAVALHATHSAAAGLNGELGSTKYSGYYVYLLLASILSLIVMKATGMMQSTAEQQRPQVTAPFIKGGAVFFMICGILLSGFKFVSVVDGSCIGCSAIDAVEAALGVVLIIPLTIFVCKYSELCMTKNKLVARFSIMLLFATCLSCWSRDYVSKVVSDVTNTDFDYSICTVPNETSINESANSFLFAGHRVAGLASNGSRFDSFNQDSSDVLVPTTLTYYFIMSAFMLIVYGNIGGPHNLRFYDSPRKHLTLRSSCVGLSLGGLVLLLSIAYVVAYTFALAKQHVAPENRDIPMIYYSFIICLYPFTILCNLTSHLKMRRDRGWLRDDAREGDLRLTLSLLSVSACGVFVTAIFNIIAAGASSPAAHPPTFLLTHECLKVLDISVQVVFLYDAVYRQPPEFFAPNFTREIMMFQIFTNFTFFWTNIYGLRDSDISPVQYCFYGFETWTIIAQLAAPLAVYYRFHCFVMYAELWMYG